MKVQSILKIREPATKAAIALAAGITLATAVQATPRGRGSAAPAGSSIGMPAGPAVQGVGGVSVPTVSGGLAPRPPDPRSQAIAIEAERGYPSSLGGGNFWVPDPTDSPAPMPTPENGTVENGYFYPE